MLATNLRLLALLPEITSLSPLSKTNLPPSKFAESLAEIGKLFSNSVSVALLLWINVISSEVLPTFAICAKRTTPVYPTGAV